MARSQYVLPRNGKSITVIPTKEQAAIIDAIVAGKSIIVDATAGSSKTTTIEMAAQDMSPCRAIAIAFNVKIVKELEARLPKWMHVRTANGLGHRAVGALIGRKPEVNKHKTGDIVRELLKGRKFNPEDNTYTNVVKLVALAKHRGIIPADGPWNYRPLLEDTDENWADIADEHLIDLEGDVILHARRALRASIEQAYAGLIDFDDQIYISTLFGAPFEHYETAIVDELQDLSPIQHKQLAKVRPRQFIGVGDPRQAIYAFRGADSKSMENVEREFPDLTFEHLPLATSFRCPKKVVELQQKHYPSMRAFETNPEGEVKRLSEWMIDSIPPDTAILCRNNAPLVDLAFKLLRQRIGFTFIGRDMGKNLKNLLKKICGQDNKDTQACMSDIQIWKLNELSRVRGKPDRQEAISDRAESLAAIIGSTQDLFDAMNAIEEMFADRTGSFTLSTGHKAKGLEWKHVLHLDPWRIPSKWAVAAEADGFPAAIEQENNLRYVIETRTLSTLFYAKMEDFGHE